MNVGMTPKKNWAYIFSPCVILAIILLLIIGIYALAPVEHGEEKAYMIYAIMFLLPCLVISLLIDFIIRFYLKKVKTKARSIWLIEGIFILFVFVFLGVWMLAEFS